MTPQQALDRAMQMILSPEFEPQIDKAFKEAASIPAAAAALVGPIVIALMQETDVPDEELLGTEDGDGIAIHLLQEIINIAGESGYLPEEGDEQMARQLGEEAVEFLAQQIAQAREAMRGAAQGGQGQQNPMAAQGPPQGQPMQQPQAGGLLEGA